MNARAPLSWTRIERSVRGVVAGKTLRTMAAGKRPAARVSRGLSS